MNKKNKLTAKQYEEIFDSIPEGLIVADTNLDIININESAENILNISFSQAASSNISKFFPKDLVDLCDTVIKDERIIYEEGINYRTPLNELIEIDCIGSPIYKFNGALSGIVIQIRNKVKINLLSNIKSGENPENTFENLIRGMVHELNNPLSGIKGAAQLISGKLSADEINKCSDIIIKEVERLKNLTERLKRLDSFHKGSFSYINIKELLLDIIFLESNLHHNINFVKNFDITIPPIYGDETSLKQVFINIIRNAIESITEDEGKIEIKTKWVTDYKIQSKNSVEIIIKDNGRGIQKNNLSKIFTPFYSNKKRGSGLGLFISNQIISKHQGVILVKSESGKGTEFQIHLPVKNS